MQAVYLFVSPGDAGCLPICVSRGCRLSIYLCPQGMQDVCLFVSPGDAGCLSICVPRGCRLSRDEIVTLAESLSDGTVFGIATELKEIQHISMASLAKERKTLLKSVQVG